MTSKKQIIISIARSVLIREGGQQFSVRKVAAEAGMSLGNLQYHFKTKTELLEGVLESSLDLHRDYVEWFMTQDLTGQSALRQLITSGFDVDAEEQQQQLYQAIHFHAEGLDKQLCHIYQQSALLVEQCLMKISDGACSNAQLKRATHFLIVYAEGYGSIHPYIDETQEDAVDLLTELLSTMLRL